MYSLSSYKNKESLLIFDKGLSKMYNMEIEFDVIPKNSDSKFGVITRYQSESEWTYIGCDQTSDILTNSHWNVVSPSDKKEIAVEISKFYKNYKRHVRIECLDKTVSVYIDGEKIAHTTASLMGDKAGFIGFRAHDGAGVEVSNVSVNTINRYVERPTKPSTIKLETDKMSVTFLKDFPSVFQYNIKENNIQVDGTKSVAKSFVINGKTYPSKTKATKLKDKVVYYSIIPEIKVGITTEFSIQDMTLNMQVTSIEENGEYRVKTIGFPNHDIVSINNSDNVAMLSIANHVKSDSFIELKDRIADTTALYSSLAILNNDRVAMTIDNNSIYNTKQISYQTKSIGGENYTSLFSNEWIYRGITNETLPLPEMKVIFATDINEDKVINWQDAAYALSKVYPEPFGADMIRNSYATITMNFASGGQYPFLRQLDNIKKFHQATDGFGQMLELKGYQSEGHDSAHPDYAGNYNSRAGGLKDLQFLTEKAKEYNAHIGFHINHSESYPEAKAYDDEIITDIPGWAWLDQAYLINKEADIKRGTFEQRLDQMKSDLPHLSFVYIDTYRENRTIASYTAKKFRDNGWPVWTEDPEVFYREAIWTHYVPEAKSLISRFVHHTFRDGYAEHPLLLGGYSRSAEIGFMGWQKGRDFNGVLHSFFTKQLPYRYMMHHSLMNIDDTKAYFEDELVVEVIDSIHMMSKNGHTIKKGDNLFIPWNPKTQEKIYHYNTEGATSTWTLPESWKSISKISLYKLTGKGREWVSDLNVNANREIIIDSEAKQGYVIYKNRVVDNKLIAWGDGGLISNPGFDGGLSNWDVLGDEANIFKTTYGQDVLQMSGTTSVSQEMDIENSKHYTLSVWCKVDGDGKATLSIGDNSYSIGESTVVNFTDNTDRYNTKFQRIKIPFTADDKNRTVTLSFDGQNEESFAQFDDVRIVESLKPQNTNHSLFEDFEDVDEGWGPFIASKPSSYTTHLSELHEGYTEDTIDGNFSFKTWREGNGEVYRTSPSMIRFKPNTTYNVKFDYKSFKDGVYSIVVKSLKEDNELINLPLDGASALSFEFTTTAADDYYICIFKNGNGIFVIDNFSIDGELDK